MAVPKQTDRDLNRLQSELQRLEAEYNMFFSGQTPKPPSQTRSRVDAMVKQLDRVSLANYADRFRFTTLQSRYASLVELWDRGLRSREEGRPGPFAHRTPPDAASRRPADGILYVTALRDPAHQADKLRELYESLTEAKRGIGEETVPFHTFAELVTRQMTRLGRNGDAEVAFRVAVKDGKVALTARALTGTKG
ncbi:MAG: hypothetical protein GEU82_07625 [Luteitalea sp.]|nr:hypothetical protein [Luteitalea sp.]